MAKIVIFSAPSGCGKSTIIHALMEQHPDLNLHFGITATSRPPRGEERDGVEYFFLSPEEFSRRIGEGAFLEWCEVYEGRYYGSLKSVVDGMLEKGQNVVMDLDVVGAQNIKRQRPHDTLTVFIQPPSIEALRQRLVSRGTDSAEVIEQRLARAEFEIGEAPKFDHIVLNDNLQTAIADAYRTLRGEL
ncbi:MAG: guanylate kinase [Bacteroidales bacterium]|nr:guanylate kinase [Candidatus Equimonas faecalis]